LTEDGEDITKIDLCPGRGSWRVQHLAENEYIIGLHSYVVADDESTVSQPDNGADEDSDSSWLDSLGFIVYKFEQNAHEHQPKRPRGRPRVLKYIFKVEKIKRQR